jgi:hypothetical protein
MSLAAIRAKLQAQENRTTQNQGMAQSDNGMYPHWNMQEGQSATVRFLPDGDTSNSFFWVEKAMIKLPFQGIKGQAGSEGKEYIVQVPCMEMYGENCPILAEVRTWYKDEGLKEIANKYWKKRTYLFQGFVRSNPLTEDKTPENPIRRFLISPQIFGVIKASLMDPEIEELPTDFVRGLDFNIKKTSKGGYGDYTTSGWGRRESALTEVEQAAIEAHGLFNLKDFLPKKPSDTELRVIKEMFEASVDGRPYDPDRWSQYYKPWGLNVAPAGQSAGNTADAGDEPAPVSRPQPAAKAEPVAESASTPPWEGEEEAPRPTAKPAVSSDKAQDILAMIRSRQQNKVA